MFEEEKCLLNPILRRTQAKCGLWEESNVCTKQHLRTIGKNKSRRGREMGLFDNLKNWRGGGTERARQSEGTADETDEDGVLHSSLIKGIFVTINVNRYIIN